MSKSSTLDHHTIKVLDSTGFNHKVLSAEGRFAVEFMSYGCGHCRAIEPALQQVAQSIALDETIYQVDITADPDLADQYQVTGTPTFVMFEDGQEVGRAEGPNPDFTSVQDAVTAPFVV